MSWTGVSCGVLKGMIPTRAFLWHGLFVFDDTFDLALLGRKALLAAFPVSEALRVGSSGISVLVAPV